MKRVFVAENVQAAHVVRALLEAEGIRAIVQNENLFDIRGGVAMDPATLPEVWIIDDAREAEALELIAQKREGAAEEAFLAASAEQSQEEPASAPVSRERGVRWFVAAGLLLAGFACGWIAKGHPVGPPTAYDDNNDGRTDLRYSQALCEKDVNLDGAMDEFWSYDAAGRIQEYSRDINFDGVVDEKTFCDRRGTPLQTWFDSDFDGEYDGEYDYENGVAVRGRSRRTQAGPVVAEWRYEHGYCREAYIDSDDDGTLDRRIVYDRFGRPFLADIPKK